MRCRKLQGEIQAEEQTVCSHNRSKEGEMSYFPEFDKHGRYIESPCYGCDQPDCSLCPREHKAEEACR